MSKDQREIARKLRILRHAEETGHVAKTCRYFRTPPEIIRLVVMMCVRFPLSLRNAECIPHARGIGVSYESVN